MNKTQDPILRIKWLKNRISKYTAELRFTEDKIKQWVAKKDAAKIKKMPVDLTKMTKSQIQWLLRSATDYDMRSLSGSPITKEHRQYQVEKLKEMGFGNLGAMNDTENHIGIILSPEYLKKHIGGCEKYLKMFVSALDPDVHDWHPAGMIVVVPWGESLKSAVITKQGVVYFYDQDKLMFTGQAAKMFHKISDFLRHISV